MKYIFKKKSNILSAYLIDAAGYSLARLFGKKPSHGVLREPKNLLLIRLDHLGDVLTASALPKAVKEDFPRCRVIFLTSSAGAELLLDNPFIDEVLCYDAPWFWKGRGKRPKRGLGFWRLVRELRKRKIETAVGLRGDMRENFLMACARIPERVGYGVTGGGFFLTREVPYRKLAHEKERSLELLRVFGIKVSSLVPQIYFSEKETASLEGKLAEWGLKGTRNFIALQVDAGTPAKQWPSGYFKELIRRLNERFPSHPIILVGANPAGADGLQKNGARWVDLSGKTTVRELCLLMSALKFFVGHDSGPTHIAAASGVPTVFLYSGTNAFEQWKPLFENAAVLRHPVSCSPCHRVHCNVKGHPCLAEISPEEVFKIVEAKLS